MSDEQLVAEWTQWAHEAGAEGEQRLRALETLLACLDGGGKELDLRNLGLTLTDPLIF